MHFLFIIFFIILPLNCVTSSYYIERRTVNGATVSSLSRLPFFGGGVGQLLRYIRPLEMANSNQRRSELRSELDANYISYKGSQLWKLNFNATRKLDDNDDDYHDDERKKSSLMSAPTTDAEFNQMVEEFVPGFPGIPLALWSLNSSELYDTTFESLQWLSPTDLRRFDFISASSSYQINRRYRNNASTKRYYGYQLWKLHETRLREPRLNAFWHHFGTEVWNINQDGIDILIEQKNVAAAREFMDKASFSYNIMIDDIETAIDETYTEVIDQESGMMESNSNNNTVPWMEREGVLMSWRRYHDHSDIQQFLQNILETHSDLVEIIQIGVTRNKRPLEVLRVSNGNPDNWAVFVDAGLQARDWLSPAAVTYAISKLTWLWSNDELDRNMRQIDWYFLPIANPDGYQYSRLTDRLWTKNRNFDSFTGCYGVNLDRNFDQGWSRTGGGSTSNPCKNLYSGTNSFSETETRAMRNFLVSLGQDYLGAYISFGGYGQTITYPWGDADYATANQRQLRNTGKEAVRNLRRLNQAEYSLGNSYRQKLARPGNSADWVQERIEPQFVYNVFLKDQGRYGYLMPPHYIVESGEEAYDFMRTIAKNLK